MITPDLASLIGDAVETKLDQLHVALPGVVVDYDPTDGTATIELQVRDVVMDADGVESFEDHPKIPGVPVIFPRSSGAFITWVVQPGDRMLVVFCSQSIDQWLGTGIVSNTNDSRRHDISHAVAIPGLYPMISPLTPVTDAPTSGMALGVPGGKQIRIASTVKLGGVAATQPIIKGTAFQSAFNTWLAALQTLLSTCTGPTGAQQATYTAAATAMTAALAASLSTDVLTT